MLDALIQAMSEGDISRNNLTDSSRSAEAEFEDVNIICSDCGSNFIWTSGEQVFFRDKNLLNPPKRCRDCKRAKNERIAAVALAQESGIPQKVEVAVNCARCGERTTVPFYPSQGRPVYCRSCYLDMNPSLLQPPDYGQD